MNDLGSPIILTIKPTSKGVGEWESGRVGEKLIKETSFLFVSVSLRPLRSLIPSSPHTVKPAFPKDMQNQELLHE